MRNTKALDKQEDVKSLIRQNQVGVLVMIEKKKQASV